MRENKYHYLLKGKKLVGKPVECRVESPWFRGSRRFKNTAQGILLEETFNIKTRRVPVSDLIGKEFAKFQKSLLNCLETTAVLFK